MRQDELLLTILGITILLNVLLVVASWLRARSFDRRRGRTIPGKRRPGPPPAGLAGIVLGRPSQHGRPRG